jgi:transcriptional regulator with XRE-family HTH domain
MARPPVYPTPRTREAALGLQLRQERERRSICRLAIAVELGVSESCLAYWELGGHRPSLDDLQRWARARDMDLTILLTTKRG